MAVPLTGSGSIFVRLGHLAGGGADVLALMGGTATARVLSGAKMTTRVGTIFTDYTAGTALPVLLDGVTRSIANTDGDGAWQTSQSSLLNFFQQLAQKTVITQVDADAVLQQHTIYYALAELCRQMLANGDSVNASAPSAGSQTSLGTPTGDNVVVCSVKSGKGALLEYALAETVTIICTQDRAGGATAWREPFSVRGEASVGAGSHLWPAGSGSTATLNSVDSLENASSTSNLLANSDFDTATTTNHPDNWVKTTATLGTTSTLDTGTVYGPGTKSLKLTGDGAELTCWRQPFNKAASTTADAGGSSVVLKPDQTYHLSFYYKLTNASPAAGVLRVSLVDGSNAVLSDDASTANSTTVTLTGVGDTNWHNVTAAFRTPKVMDVDTAGTYKLEIKLTTALTSAKGVYIDRVTLTPATQLYAGGPFFSIHSGQTKPAKDDAYTLAISQTWGSFQQWFERWFGMRALGLQLPSDSGGSETVADSLVA